MKLTTRQKIKVTSHAILLMGSIAVVAGTIFIHNASNANHLGDKPGIMALAAIIIAVVVTVMYRRWLEIIHKKNRKIPRSIKVVVFAVVLAIGLSCLILPALFAPALILTIAFALTAIGAVMIIAFTLNPKTRGTFTR